MRLQIGSEGACSSMSGEASGPTNISSSERTIVHRESSFKI
jgi:hypothetical protein